MPNTVHTMKTTLMFEHVAGPEVDADTVLDAFAFENGAQNGAGPGGALLVQIDDSERDEQSIYRLKLVD